ncbi:hypothetical protein K502DRAFT_70489 [Neoconidiobolus thromboides FSU 785]|nr:hypothetical protein K502DRAFT_70489 [Neoconidiobolus thromboides FSU 785]
MIDKQNKQNKQNNLFEDIFNEIKLSSDHLQSLEYIDSLYSEPPIPEEVIKDITTDIRSLTGSPFLNIPTTTLTPKLVNSISPNLSKSPLSDTNNEISLSNSMFLPTKEINSIQAFQLWFNNLEPYLFQGKEDIYQSYINQLNLYIEKIQKIKKNILQLQETSDNLTKQYQKMEINNQSIQQICFDIIQENETLINKIEIIEKELVYFNQLTPIYQFLSSPGTDMCYHSQFKPTLYLLDNCINFMKLNLNYKDSKLYLDKYQQCMTRALSIIHLNFYESINKLELNNNNNNNNNNISINDINNLQQKLRYLASEIRPLIFEIESRYMLNNDYNNLLLDCFDCYINFRLNSLNSFITQLACHNDLIISTLDGIAHLTIIIRDEETLFRSYFIEGEQELNSFLNNLLKLFFDTLSDTINKKLKGFNKKELAGTQEQLNLVQVYKFLFDQYQIISSSTSKAVIKDLLESMKSFIPVEDQLT